jgi:TPR repeat protein
MKIYRAAIAAILLCFATVTVAPTAQADFNAGVAAYEKGDFKTAFAEFLKLAKAGDKLAQYNLGLMYANGQGVARSGKAAFDWTEKSAKQNHAPAQHNLGVFYENGLGVAKDIKQAIAWYTRAANQGHAPAQHNLGVFHQNGAGVAQDFVKAHD